MVKRGTSNAQSSFRFRLSAPFMKKQKYTYHVIASSLYKWVVRRSDAIRVSSIYSNKKEAINEYDDLKYYIPSQPTIVEIILTNTNEVLTYLKSLSTLLNDLSKISSPALSARYC